MPAVERISNMKWDRTKLFLVASLLLSSVLFIALCIFVFLRAGSGDTEVCLTPQCINAATLLIDSIDKTADPCQDFWQFSCGNWPKKNRANLELGKLDWFIKTNPWLQREVLDFLRQNDSSSEPFPVHQARSLYRSCKTTRENETIAKENGGKILQEKLKICNESLMVSLARTKRFFSINSMISFYLLRDKGSIPTLVVENSDISLMGGSPQRNSYHREQTMRLRRSNMDLSFDQDKYLRERTDYAVQLFEYFDDNFCDIGKDELLHIAENVFFFPRIIFQFAQDPEEFEEVTVKDLQNIVDSATQSGKSKIDWLTYFNTLYEPDMLPINENTIVNIYNRKYFSKLSSYLETVDDDLIKWVMWYDVLDFIVPLISTEMADLKNNVFQENFKAPPYKRDPCLEAVGRFMPFAAGYVTAEDEKINKDVSKLFSNVQETFAEMIKDVTWLDTETKLKCAEKILSARSLIGFPEVVKDRKSLEDFYSGLIIDEDNYLENIPAALEYMNKAKATWKNILYFNVIPTVVNAYFDPMWISVGLPPGILRFPFYDLGLESMNYGNLGKIIGHELAHGLDRVGMEIDKNGIRQNWWTLSGMEEYYNRTKCLIDQYNSFKDPTDSENYGFSSMAENVGDLVGVQVAYKAYKKYEEENGKEPKLPSLEQFSSAQLFFLSYGNFWCADLYDGKERNIGLKSDKHAANRARSILPLTNFPEFSKTWKCPLGSPMNRPEKCKIWFD